MVVALLLYTAFAKPIIAIIDNGIIMRRRIVNDFLYPYTDIVVVFIIII
jgi:hypothetical protein